MNRDRAMTAEEAAATFGPAGEERVIAAADGSVVVPAVSATASGVVGTPVLPEGWENALRILFAEVPRHVRRDGPMHLLGAVTRVRDFSPLPDYGPGVIVEQAWDARPNFSVGQYGHWNYGRRAEVRVIFLVRGVVLPLWLESGDLEAWPVSCEHLIAE